MLPDTLNFRRKLRLDENLKKSVTNAGGHGLLITEL
jgi:hypothetical protein